MEIRRGKESKVERDKVERERKRRRVRRESGKEQRKPRKER